MRTSAVAQFRRGFSQADIHANFALSRSGEQELQGDRGFAATRAAFEQVQTIAGETATEDVVETGNAGGRAGKDFGLRLHGS